MQASRKLQKPSTLLTNNLNPAQEVEVKMEVNSPTIELTDEEAVSPSPKLLITGSDSREYLANDE